MTRQNGFFKSANAFLEYDGLSFFEISYRGDYFDEEPYRDIFQKLQNRTLFWLSYRVSSF